MTLWKWSTDPATNGSADATCPWPEGMAPSQVNDSARGGMAAVAKWRDDITGINVTTGTGTAYSITSNQGIAANLNGFTVQFIPNATNTGPVTLSVDGQTAKPIRFSTGVDLPAGALISGSLYQATYRSATEEWLLHSFDASIYAIPIGGGIDYWGSTLPSDNFAFAYGQAISRADYPVCFARLGTAYGSGDGSTTFNLPDKRGRTSAGVDGMGGSSANRLTASGGMTGNGIGSVGGAQSHTLTTGEMPSHFHSALIYDPGHPHGSFGSIIRIGGSGTFFAAFNSGSGNQLYYGSAEVASATTGVRVTSSNGLDTTYSAGSGAAHNNTQPTITCNYIIRIK